MIQYDCIKLKGWEKAGKLKTFISELKSQVDGREVLLAGGAFDPYKPTNEIVIRLNYHFRNQKKTDINILNILRIANPYYPWGILSGVMALRCLTETEAMEITVAGFDFYLTHRVRGVKPGEPKVQVGGHPIGENVEVFLDLISDKRVAMSPNTFSALEIYREHFGL